METINSATDEFLNTYKELEQVLRIRAEQSSEHSENSIARFLYSEEGAPYRDALNAAREIRNLLQHLPKVGGTYPVVPSKAIIAELKKIKNAVEHPMPAMDCAVPEDRIYKANIGTRLKDILAVMHDWGFTQVPIMENTRMVGVLSVQCVFSYITDEHMITDDTKIRDMSDYILPDAHQNEYYRFAPITTTYIKADEMFKRRDRKHRRLAAIFLTEHGKFGEPPLGLLTPWSVLSQKGEE